MTILDDPRHLALIDLFRRFGAAEFSIGYADDVFPDVTVWLTLARLHPTIVERSGYDPTVPVYRTGSGTTIGQALEALTERMTEGAVCRHCGRPAAVEHDHGTAWPPLICAYQWDPELKTYRRSCTPDVVARATQPEGPPTP